MKINKECIDGCLRGENAAQRQLYDQLLPYLNAIVGRYLDDLSHRKDILQEAFILIFNKIDRFDPEKGAFYSWASKIIINLSLKHNKTSKSRFYSNLDGQEEFITVDPKVINQLSNEELIKFLRTMPDKYYQVFNLYAIDGFSHQEISELLGIRTGLSRKRLARARNWLQEKPVSLNKLLGDYRFSIS